MKDKDSRNIGESQPILFWGFKNFEILLNGLNKN
jgi:hypothetical protein